MSAATKRTVLNPFSGPSDVSKSARLRAWWNGVDPTHLANSAGPGVALPASADNDSENTDSTERWSLTDIEVAQMVFGDGFVEPGGAAFFLELVKPLALSPAMSILNLTAGLGGSSRAIVETLGAWVDGLESSRTLAAEGMEQSKMAGVGKKAPIVHFDPEALELKPKKYDCAFSHEALYTIENKTQFFEVVVESLKDVGQLQFTDFMLRDPGLQSDAINEWLAHESVRTYLWCADEYRKLCKDLKLDVRISKDIGTEWSNHVSAGWDEFTSPARIASLDQDSALTVVRQAEMWTRRVAAIKSGDIQLMRFHALLRRSTVV